MNLQIIFNRVIKWNSLRYDREYNHELSMNLVLEELLEFHDAQSDVDELDALCDLIYVALGALWKLDLTDEQMQEAISEAGELSAELFYIESLSPIYQMSSIIAAMNGDPTFSLVTGYHTLIYLCLGQMDLMGLGEDNSMAALLIVCDSNDTKSVPSKKVSPMLKANGQDKGPLFIAPEPRLKAILEAVYGQIH